MQARNIILGLAGLVVLGVVALLLLKVKGDSKPEISEEKRAQALAEYQRRSGNRVTAGEQAEPDDGDAEDAKRPRRVRERRLPTPPSPSDRARSFGREERRSSTRVDSRPDLARPGLGERDESEGGNDSDPVKQRMTEATSFYDRGNYPAAQEVALEVLERDPNNVKMLRVAVSTLCATGDVDKAAKYLQLLPSNDRDQMKKRCQKWGAEIE